MNTRTCSAAALISFLTVLAGAAPQPEGRPAREQRPAGQPAEGGQRPDGRPDMRELIERRLEQIRRQEERLKSAMKRLEEGATNDELLDEFPDLGRPRQGGPGGPGGGGEPDFGGPGGLPPELDEGPDGQGMRGPGRGMRERGGAGGPGGPGGPGGRGEPGEGGPDWAGERPGIDRPLTDDEHAAVREFLLSAQPRLHTMLTELEKSDPEEAARKLTEMFPRVRPLIEMRQRDRKMYDLRLRDFRNGREAMEAARWLVENEKNAEANDADRDAKRAQLRTALVAQFDTRTEISRHELDRQAARAETARADLDKRSTQREGDVDRMMERMIERERQRLLDGDHGPGDPSRGEPHRPMRRGDRG